MHHSLGCRSAAPPFRASGFLLHRQASSFGLHHCCRACLGPHTQQAGQERSPPKRRLPLLYLGDLLRSARQGRNSSRSRPRAAMGLGGAGRGPQAPSGCAKPRHREARRETAILLHCAASRRGHREPSILPKTHIPAPNARIESIFSSAEALPHIPLLTMSPSLTAKTKGNAFRTAQPPLIRW